MKKEEGHAELLYYYYHHIFNKIKVQLIPVSLEIIAIYQCTLLKMTFFYLFMYTSLTCNTQDCFNLEFLNQQKIMQRYCTYILYLNDHFFLSNST